MQVPGHLYTVPSFQTLKFQLQKEKVCFIGTLFLNKQVDCKRRGKVDGASVCCKAVGSMHKEHSGGDVMLNNTSLAARNYFFRDSCCKTQKQFYQYICEHGCSGLWSYPPHEAHVTLPTPI